MFEEFFLCGFSYGIVLGVVGCGLMGCCLGGGVLLPCAIVVWMPCEVFH